MDPSALAEARSSSPLAGVVICFTSIQGYEREKIATIAANLGASTTYDLTKATTHLLVGNYDTPKYRHVARSRPDICAMDAQWIYAVRNAWRADEFDFDVLENKYKLRPLETGGVPTDETADADADDGDAADINTNTNNNALQKRPALKICLTGVEDIQERREISSLIESGGATYTGELNHSVTHLLVARASGMKYRTACQWGIHTVSLLWLTQSLKRGMILDEKYFNPLLSADEQGPAFNPIVPTKRKLADNESTVAATTAPLPETKLRKLRKTASLKLGSQQASVWTSILSTTTTATTVVNRPAEAADSSFAEPPDTNTTTAAAPDTEPSTASSPPLLMPPPPPLQPQNQLIPIADAAAIFAGCAFYIYGFAPKKMRVARQAVATRGALVGDSIEATIRLPCAGPKFALVPQEMPEEQLSTVRSSQLVVVTEFFVEKCLFKKKLFDPADHVVGRPFPVFPIAQLVGLRVHMTGFSGIDLLHVQRTLEQLGAVVEENFSPAAAVLIVHSLAGARKEKLTSAVKLQLPIVSADWLWACVEAGEQVPFEEFYFKELQGVMARKRQPLRRSRAESRLERVEPPRDKAAGGPLFDVSESALNKAAATDAAREKAAVGLEKRAANASFLKAVMEDQEIEAAEDQEKQATEEQGGEEAAEPRRALDARPQAAERAHTEPEPKQAEPKQDAKAQQRRALSDQLFNLMTATSINEDSAPAAAPAFVTAPAAAPEVSPMVVDETPVDSGTSDGLKKRTRRAFGRNISSASAYSDADLASRELPATVAAAQESGSKKAADGEKETDGKDKTVVTSTQVEYRDPEAAKVRAALLSRLEGGEETASARGGGRGRGRGRRR